jgi:hypothetical protein
MVTGIYCPLEIRSTREISMNSMRVNLFYRISAWSLMAAFIVILVLDVLVVNSGASSVENLPIIVKLPLSLIGAVGVLSLFALWPGMIWHCLTVHRTSIAKKALWIVLLLLTIPLGSIVYYFSVFKRETDVSS